LVSVGFLPAMMDGGVSALSGGWKMKLAIARAMLQQADILLLDEPTNHLDVGNVTWAVNYLTGLKDVTSVIVSHDASFLDRTCTDIIQCDHRRLRNYRGNLSAFVARVPEAKAYHALKASDSTKFTFPDPAPLDGIKSRGRALVRMRGVDFTYPNTTRQILKGITIVCSMASRTAVVGPNGAGKSTMIKLLTGELEPLPGHGTVWKHPELVLAYVAQHAFHHIENHLDKTPSEYIRWRFAGGGDKEAIDKATRTISSEERMVMKQEHSFENGKEIRVIDSLKGRQPWKRSFEYGVKWLIKREGNRWVPMPEIEWVSRPKLVEWGWEKTMNKMDDEEQAQSLNIQRRALSMGAVEEHCGEMGLEPEFCSHTRMDALSTSQKVKVVIAAALWNNPQIIVLDEPTNYLDRESLGALADAIREFKGGVVMISHNNEFTSALCSEQWVMSDGRLVREGEIPDENGGKIEEKGDEAETYVDKMGNVVKVKRKKKKMTRKEKKKWMKRQAKRRKEGLSTESCSDDDLI